MKLETIKKKKNPKSNLMINPKYDFVKVILTCFKLNTF